MPQHTARLPIACVEGWSTTETWTGVPLAIWRGWPACRIRCRRSCGRWNAAARSTAPPCRRNQVLHPDSLLALRVNDADLSPDHGYPARIIVPALPGVHNTKWVASIDFRAADVHTALARFRDCLRIAPTTPVDARRAVSRCSATSWPPSNRPRCGIPTRGGSRSPCGSPRPSSPTTSCCFPIYALVDRILLSRQSHSAARRDRVGPGAELCAGAGAGRSADAAGIPARDHRAGRPAYLAATGQTQEPFLGRWLLLTAAMFAMSAVVYAVRLAVARRAKPPPG